jgi:hypothetical protein
MTSHKKISAEEAESTAVQALSFLVGDGERLERFLDVTGLRPDSIRAAAASPGFHAAILDYVAGDERLLLDLAGEIGTTPERIMQARAALSPPEAW